MALLVAGAVVLIAAAAGVRAVLGAAGGYDGLPGGSAGPAAAGTTVADQESGVSVAAGGGGPGGQGAPGGSAGGGIGRGGTPRTTTSRPTTSSGPTTTQGTSTTLPPIVVQGTSWSASESCYSGSDGRWHYHVQFHITVDSIGVGTVRYRWGRGADDVRSEVET